MGYMTLDEIMEFKINDNNIYNLHKPLKGYKYWHCPRCKERLYNSNHVFEYICTKCNQIIDWSEGDKENKFKIFKNTPKEELLQIYEDILKSKELGICANSLKKYINEIKEICNFKLSSQGYKMTEELFYEEVANRYFKNE